MRQDPDYLLQLWRNEMHRVFSDKLSTNIDKEWLSSVIDAELRQVGQVRSVKLRKTEQRPPHSFYQTY